MHWHAPQKRDLKTNEKTTGAAVLLAPAAAVAASHAGWRALPQQPVQKVWRMPAITLDWFWPAPTVLPELTAMAALPRFLIYA